MTVRKVPTLKALAAQILDPRYGVLIDAFDVAGEGAVFRMPNGTFLRTYIDVAKLLRRDSFREVLLSESAALLRRIAWETDFTCTISHPGPAQSFSYLLKSSLLDLGRKIKFYSLPISGIPSDLKGNSILIITDVLETGVLVRRISNSIAEAGGRVAAIFSLLDLRDAFGSPIRLLDGISQKIPTYCLLRIPFRNQIANQYDPSKVLVPEGLYADVQVNESQKVIDVFAEVNMALKAYLARHPERVYDLSSHQFEKLVASILKDFGFDVELTRATRDGGRDIMAWIRNAVCSVLTYVECKKYSVENKVGVEVVRSLYGVHNMHNANKSLIVTTSFFTRDAVKEASHVGAAMELKDYNDLKSWLALYTGG